MTEFPRKSAVKTQLMLFMTDKDRSNNDALKIVEFVIDKVATDVANYCNLKIDEIPEVLDATIVGMASQYIDLHNLMPSMQENNDQVQSLTEGDVSYTFKSKANVYSEIQSANTITDDFVKTLKKHRKVVF